MQEDFSYDHLHRLLQSQRYRGQGQAGHGASTADTITYQYTPNGNLLSKSDYADGYSYQANQVQSVNPILAPTQYYDYDPNGNMERVYQSQNGQAVNLKQIHYDPYNKPTKIDDQAKGRILEFSYGSNDQRFYQLKDLNGDYTVYIDKLYEAYGDGNSSQDTGAKLYIGDYAVYDLDLDPITGEGEANLQYLYRDRLGSVVSMADANGGLIDSAGRGFDPFGKPREDDWRDSDGQNGETPSQSGDLNRNDLTTRGFTGHEHLNETDLIHMNGRVYDYNLGRFLSVDPFIQFPENSQSMNAYSYILNNPLSGTDPTGYTTEAPDASQSGTGNSSGGNSASDQAKEMSAEGGEEKVTFTHQRGRTGCRACKGAVTGGTVTFGNGSSVSFSVKNGQIAGINGASLSPTVGSNDKMDLMSGLGDMSDRPETKQEELFGLPDLDVSTMTAQANTNGNAPSAVAPKKPASGGTPQTTSSDGVDFIKGWEKYKSKPYKVLDENGKPTGKWTVGYGHEITDAEYQSGQFNNVSRAEAEKLFVRDLSVAEATVHRFIANNNATISLSQNQFDALVSLAFNSGYIGRWPKISANFASGNHAGVAMEFLDIVNGGSKGLIKRRIAESNLYSSGNYSGRP